MEQNSEALDALTKCVEVAPSYSKITHVTRRVNELLDLDYTDAKWRGLLKDNPTQHEKIKKALGTAKDETPDTIHISGNIVGAVINDVHVPYHDKTAIALACKVLAWWRPEVIVYNGDLLDFYDLSRYDKNPGRQYRLQDEIDMFHTDVVAPINHAVGKRCRKIFLPGNHEARLQKFLMAHPELFSLRDLELRNVLKLSNYDIEYAAYSVQFGDVLEVSHGTRVNKWAGMSAKAEQELRRYSMSTITGHVHRSGTFKTKVGNEWKTGQESPCLCTLKPEYMRNPDWQQGVTLFTVTDKICRIYPVEFSGQFAQFAKQTFKA